MKRKLSIFIILLMLLFILHNVAYASNYNIAIEGGNDQKVQVSCHAKHQLAVRVTDYYGQGIRTNLVFDIIKGDGKLSHKNISTDTAGRARVTFKAGMSPGPVTVRARLADVPARNAEFNLKVTLEDPHKKVDASPQATPAPKETTKPAPVKPAPEVKETPKPAPTPKKTETPKPAPEKTPDIKPAGIPAVIIGFGGNNQKITPGESGRDPVEVQVMDNQGNPLSGVTINFHVAEGPASVVSQTAVTDSRGIAGTKIRTDGVEGSITVKAQVAGDKELGTQFYLMAQQQSYKPVTVPSPSPAYTPEPTPYYTPEPTPGPETVPTPPPDTTPEIDPGTLRYPEKETTPRGFYSRNPEKISCVGGNYQSAGPGVRLPQPVVVYVTDTDGNPAEATVQFTLLGGDAEITTAQMKTDRRGLASTFVVVNSARPIRIVAEIQEKPGLATVIYANTQAPGGEGDPASRNPVIKSSTPTNQPGFPAAISFYSVKAQNVDYIEKTRVIPLEIGVVDFRNQPVSTAVRFYAEKGKVSILNPVVQTNAQGKGVCYVDIGDSMGIFTIEAQSLENPDLKAVFKSGPQVHSGPAPKVVRPGTGDNYTPPQNPDTEPAVKAPPPGNASGKPALIAVLRGGGQKVKAGSRLPEPLGVLVTDNQGNPVSGTMVAFVVSRGRARVETPFTRTDNNGEASTYITMGGQPEVIEVTVKLQDNKSLQTTIQLESIK